MRELILKEDIPLKKKKNEEDKIPTYIPGLRWDC
jgi:hypothetical protein